MGPVGPILMVGVQVWPWNIWPGLDSTPTGEAVVLIMMYVTLLLFRCLTDVSGTVTEVVLTG